MGVDVVNDKFVERSLELQVRYLSLFKVQPESRHPARNAGRSQHESLGWRLVVIESLALCFRCRA